jgi:hypothetical protein
MIGWDEQLISSEIDKIMFDRQSGLVFEFGCWSIRIRFMRGNGSDGWNVLVSTSTS